jgi:Ca2+-binding EF-hand superfamily protein
VPPNAVGRWSPGGCERWHSTQSDLCLSPQTLDPDNKGYVEADKIRTLLTTHGERFTQEEIDDFLNFAFDAE